MKKSTWVLFGILVISAWVLGSLVQAGAETVKPGQPALQFNTAFTTTATQGAKRVVLTPAIAPRGFGIRELEQGQIVGMIETTNINNVPNGQYLIHVAKVNNVWKAHLESGGRTVAEAKSVTVTEIAEMKRPEIRFNLHILITWDTGKKIEINL
jgi:hypothetical protein